MVTRSGGEAEGVVTWSDGETEGRRARVTGGTVPCPVSVDKDRTRIRHQLRGGDTLGHNRL